MGELILETFNISPRINRKVKIIDEQDVKKTTLNKLKKYLCSITIDVKQ